MKNKAVLVLALFVAMAAGYLMATLVNSDNATVQAAALPQDSEEQEVEAATAEIDPAVIEALQSIAENTESLKEIATRLEGIERELAWKRLDDETGN